MAGGDGFAGERGEIPTTVVHVKHEVRGQNLFHQPLVNTFKIKRANKALDHVQTQVVGRNVLLSSFTNPKQQSHQSGHSSDEVEGIFFPVARGI